MKVMVTGANGFVGKSLCNRLGDSGTDLVKAVRRPRNADEFGVGNIDSSTDWQVVLEDVEVIVHAAARVHVMNESSNDSLSEFRKVNVEGSLNLARQAAA